MPDMSAASRQFNEEGFVHIEGFLSPADLREVRDALERYKREVVPTFKPEEHRALYDTIDGVRHLKHLVDIGAAEPYFARLLNEGKTRALAETLLGEQVTPESAAYFEKAPRVGTPTPAHQDGFYFCLKPNHALTLWIALDDCDQENGCLHYVRGSHRRGVLLHAGSGVTGFSQGLAAGAGDTCAIHARAGDCLAHHSLTIHSADANRSERPRRSLGLVYYAASAVRDEEAHHRYMESLALQRRQAAVAR